MSCQRSTRRWKRASCVRAGAVALACWLGCLGLLGSAAAAADDAAIARLVRQAGIRPVEPPSPALELRLSLLDGGTQELSAYQGDWVVLTFFATWCAPCVDELPTLVALQQGVAGRGVAVLGVSIDADKGALGRFVEDLGLDLVVLWDETGEAARKYRADSIPLSYLIDPAGRIVGVARGARDWLALSPLFDQLLEILPPSSEQPSVYAEGEGPVSLPIKLVPPSATVTLSHPQVAVDEPFDLDVRILWAGNFDEYLLHPPRVTLPEGVEETGISAETRGESGRSVVTYRVSLLAHEAGAFALDPVELRYTPRFEASPVSTRIAGPTVEVLRGGLGRLGGAGLAAGVGGLVLALAAVAAFVFVRRRQAVPVAAGASAVERWSAQLESAQRHRMRGEHRESYLVLVELELELLEAEAGRVLRDGTEANADLEAQRRRLEAAIERARYSGNLPPPEELDRLLRRLDIQVRQHMPKPQEAERAGLQLRGEEGLY